jgi:hypothetical protein
VLALAPESVVVEPVALVDADVDAVVELVALVPESEVDAVVLPPPLSSGAESPPHPSRLAATTHNSPLHRRI